MKSARTPMRVNLLRQWMNNEELDAFVIPTTDPHNSEYTPEHWKVRQWISGFDGSAGTAVVTASKAALWSDSRYFLAAEEQLKGSPFALMKEGMPEVPTIGEWLLNELKPGARVGFVGKMMSGEAYGELAEETEGELVLVSMDDPFQNIWTSRPALPSEPVSLQPQEFTGADAAQKIEVIRQIVLADESVEAYLLNDMSEIGWTLNLRGTDVPYNPVFLSYLLIERNKATLFVEETRLPDEVKSYLRKQGVKTAPYNAVKRSLEDLDDGLTAYHFPPTMNYDILNYCEEYAIPYRLQNSPAAALRSAKTAEEIRGFKNAMERDGVALVKFRRWLDENVGKGTITEMEVDARLQAFRQEQPLYKGLSFATIAGYGAHGAIVHYEATEESNATLKPEGLLLLDTGAQYQDATTDITRTIALGPVTEEMKKVYTLVLKGHIALSRCHFPEGTTGIQLDLAARYAMWQEGYDFGHGTGHGVGSYLRVHEGPQQIRKNLNKASTTAFRAGMTITDEPGIYLAGKFGVRIENILLVEEAGRTEFGNFLKFEPLTLCPIDIAPINKAMLTPTEKEWLNNYHSVVRQRLMPHLNDEADRNWLLKATEAI